jgi:hypothetical protein
MNKNNFTIGNIISGFILIILTILWYITEGIPGAFRRKNK